jgi:hypothetical protein
LSTRRVDLLPLDFAIGQAPESEPIDGPELALGPDVEGQIEHVEFHETIELLARVGQLRGRALLESVQLEQATRITNIPMRERGTGDCRGSVARVAARPR